MQTKPKIAATCIKTTIHATNSTSDSMLVRLISVIITLADEFGISGLPMFC
jgi:hypothetical protein